LRYSGKLIRQMLVAELQSCCSKMPPVFAGNTVEGAARHACLLAGIPRVHIINGKVDEGLLAEVFSNDGIGTLIYANEYQQIRPAKKKDIRAIQLLTKASVEAEELVKRSKAVIEKNLGDYFIFEIDRTRRLRGAACLSRTKKRASWRAVRQRVERNQGIGRKLIQFVENKAREMELANSSRSRPRRSRIFNPKALRRGHTRRSAARAP